MSVQQVEGMEALTQSMRNHAVTTQSIIAGLEAQGIKIVADMRARCPVDTGALRDAIRHEIVVDVSGPKLVIHVGNTETYYVQFVEYGSSHAPAHPFIRPIVNGSKGAMLSTLENVVLKVGI